MFTTTMQVKNLKGRSYIQGAVIVGAVVHELYGKHEQGGCSDIASFKLRLHKPIIGMPTLTVHDTAPSGACASGSFTHDGEQLYFSVNDSGEPCTEVLNIDEDALTARLRSDDEMYIIDGLTPADDPYVCWSLIERPVNLATFDKPGKMWFTGIEFDNFHFLIEPLQSVGSSVEYKRLSERCLQRKIFYNGRLVGQRTAVYA